MSLVTSPELLVDFALLALLAVTAFALVRTRDLVALAMMAGIYSFLSASLFVVMDAVDVALHRSRRRRRNQHGAHAGRDVAHSP